MKFVPASLSQFVGSGAKWIGDDPAYMYSLAWGRVPRRSSQITREDTHTHTHSHTTHTPLRAHTYIYRSIEWIEQSINTHQHTRTHAHTTHTTHTIYLHRSNNNCTYDSHSFFINLKFRMISQFGNINRDSFAKETYKTDDILQKRPIILRSPLIVATPYQFAISNNMSQFFVKIHRDFYASPYLKVGSTPAAMAAFCKQERGKKDGMRELTR